MQINNKIKEMCVQGKNSTNVNNRKILQFF